MQDTIEPSGIRAMHEAIRSRIDAGDPGHAQATVQDQLVSYHRFGPDGFVHESPLPHDMNAADLMEAVILAVALGHGRATRGAFPKSFAAMMIASRRAFDRSCLREHAEADAVSALRLRRPELFYE